MSDIAVNPDKVRRSLLVRRLFDVLRDADGPLQAAEVLRLVAEREPLTPREESATGSGQSRANNLLRFCSSWARAVGWLDKSADGWRLTPTGREALAALSDDDDLYGLLTKKYRQVQRARRDTSRDAAENEKVLLLNSALDLVEEGQWTAYSDLAELTGLANQNVGTVRRMTPTTPTGTASCTLTARCRHRSSGRTPSEPTPPARCWRPRASSSTSVAGPARRSA